MSLESSLKQAEKVAAVDVAVLAVDDDGRVVFSLLSWGTSRIGSRCHSEEGKKSIYVARHISL